MLLHPSHESCEAVGSNAGIVLDDEAVNRVMYVEDTHTSQKSKMVGSLKRELT